MWERGDAGEEGYGKVGIQGSRYVGKEGCWKGGIQERRDSRK